MHLFGPQGSRPSRPKAYLTNRAVFSAPFWRIAILTAAGMVGAASSARGGYPYLFIGPTITATISGPNLPHPSSRYRQKAAKQRASKATNAEIVAQEGKKPTGAARDRHLDPAAEG